MALDAASPGAHEGVVQGAADGGAGQGHHASDPFFGALFADADGEAARDARRELFYHLFFGEILAEVDTGRCSRCEPQLNAFIAAFLFEAIEQAKPLDQPQSNDGEEAGVWQQREHTAQAESRSLS